MTDELHDACAKGDFEQVKDLVENKGATVNQPHSFHLTYPIYFAADKGHLEIIKYLLSKGAKASDTHSTRGNLLYWTCDCKAINERDAILNHIYQNFAEYHFLDGTTKTHVAAARLAHLADFQGEENELLVPNHDGVTPLYFALLKCPLEVIKLMSAKNINYNQIIIKPADMPNPDSWHRNSQELLRSLMNRFKINQMFILALEMRNLCLAANEQIKDKTESDNTRLDWLYSDIANLFDKLARFHFAKQEYQQAIGAYKDAIAASEKIKSKTEQDHNELDVYYHNLADSFNGLGHTHYSKREYQQAIGAYKDSIAALEKIKSKTEKDHKNLDVCYRNLANSFNGIGKSHYFKQEYQQTIEAVKDAIAAREKINSRTDDDYNCLDNNYRSIANLFNMIGSSYYSKQEYQQEIGAYKDAIAAREKIKSKTEQDHNELDVYYHNLADSFNGLGHTHYSKQEYQQAIGAYKDSIAAVEKIKSKTVKDHKNLDVCYRNLANSFNCIGNSHYSKQEYQQAIGAYNEAVAEIEKIKNKSEEDYLNLDTFYRNIARSYFIIGDSHYKKKEYQQNIDFHKYSIATIENIKNKIEGDLIRLDTYHRNIAHSYCFIGTSHFEQQEYQKAIEAFRQTIAAIEKIRNKAEEDHKDLDMFYRKLADSYRRICLAYNQQQNDAQEIDTLNCERDALEKIKQKTDANHRRMSFIIKRVGEIYMSRRTWQGEKKDPDPAMCFQQAVAALMNIQNATAEDYESLAKIYNDWCKCYHQSTIACHLMKMAIHTFLTFIPSNATPTEFLQIHGEIVNNWQSLTHLIFPLIQLMELLLNGCRNQYFPNSQLKKFLLEKEDNRQFFQSKLLELKELPQLSLVNTLMQNVNPVIELANRVLALTAKASATEIEVQSQNEKIQEQNEKILALQAELLQLKQGATAVTVNNNDSDNNNDGSIVNSNSNNNNGIDNNGNSPGNNNDAKTPMFQRDSPVLAANNDKAKATPLRIKLKRKPVGDAAAGEQHVKKACVEYHAPETSAPKSLK